MRQLLFRSFSQSLVSALLLLTLHAAIVSVPYSPVGRALIVAHIGLFLIWQPIWRGDQRLNWQNLLSFLVLMGAFVIWLDWWLLTGWLILLIGLTGGRLPQTTQERNTNLVILFFLFIELLISCASHLFAIRLDDLLVSFFNTLLLFLPLLILVLPGSTTQDRKLQLQVDLFGAITTALLASLLLLGSIINSYPLTDQDYGTALVRTFLFIGVLILLISWLLSPRTGFSGLAELWTQSLLNIGTPFERWISEIATLKSDTTTPEEFINQATYKLLALPLIDGVIWENSELHGQHGTETKHRIYIDSEHFNFTIMTSNRIGATLLLHFKLLVKVIDHFYTAKQQEQELARQAHMQAVYETGARITHDIKNILQSCHNITAIIRDESPQKTEQTLRLLKKQLPSLTQRLDLALDKLQNPANETHHEMRASSWWQELRTRYEYSDVHFEDKINNDCEIPKDLFDRVSENLLENALLKQSSDTDIRISIKFIVTDANIELSVTDSGEPVPDNIRNNIFKEPLESANGLGIGLLQSADMASNLGYELDLKNNIDGNVTFSLSNKQSR